MMIRWPRRPSMVQTWYGDLRARSPTGSAEVSWPVTVWPMRMTRSWADNPVAGSRNRSDRISGRIETPLVAAGQLVGQRAGLVHVAQRFDDAARIDPDRPA